MAPGRTKEMIGSAIFILIAIVAYVEVGKVPRLGYDTLGEAAFPRMIAVVMGFSAFVIMVQAYMLRAVPTKESGRIGNSKLLQAIAAFVVFTVFAMNIHIAWVPYPISGVIFCLVTGLIYIEQINRLSVVGIILMAALFPAALDWIFRFYFYVELP